MRHRTEGYERWKCTGSEAHVGGVPALEGENMEATRWCPACHSTASTEVKHAAGGRYRICQCSACFLRFSDPMTAADSGWYEESAIYTSRLPSLASAASAMASGASRWEFRQALCDSGSGILLGIGCGQGEFLHLAKHAGYTVTGVDFNEQSVQFARAAFGISSVYRYLAGELVRSDSSNRIWPQPLKPGEMIWAFVAR